MSSSQAPRSHPIGAREWRVLCEDPTAEILSLDCGYVTIRTFLAGELDEWQAIDARAMAWSLSEDDAEYDTVVTVEYRY